MLQLDAEIIAELTEAVQSDAIQGQDIVFVVNHCYKETWEIDILAAIAKRKHVIAGYVIIINLDMLLYCCSVCIHLYLSDDFRWEKTQTKGRELAAYLLSVYGVIIAATLSLTDNDEYAWLRVLQSVLEVLFGGK